MNHHFFKKQTIFLFLIVICAFFLIISNAASTTFREIPVNQEETMSESELSTTNPETSTQISIKEEDLYSDLRIAYADGFYFQPIPPDVEKRITGCSYPVNCPISISDLKYVRVQYYDFNNQIQEGELIVHASIAMDILEIFKELFDAGYQIEKMRLIDDYNGNDEASMADNNTSAFNYRLIDGTTTLSDHSLGLAIDINPLYNPYVRTGFGDRNILPVTAVPYADRNADFPHKIEKDDICYNAFISRGFLWGGNWNDTKDYQHFYKPINIQ